MYDRGQRVVQDNKEAIKWFHNAALQGVAFAQVNLGRMYDKGQGVPQDYIQAHMWSNLAATIGAKDAIKNRDIIAKKMTPADISKAHAMAREWMKKFEARKNK